MKLNVVRHLDSYVLEWNNFSGDRRAAIFGPLLTEKYVNAFRPLYLWRWRPALQRYPAAIAGRFGAVLLFHAVQGQRIVPIAAVNIAAMIAAARVDPIALHLLALGLRAAPRTTIPSAVRSPGHSEPNAYF